MVCILDVLQLNVAAGIKKAQLEAKSGISHV